MEMNRAAGRLVGMALIGAALIYPYYKKLNPEERKNFFKENGILSAMSLVVWAILLYVLTDTIDTLSLWTWAVILSVLTVLAARGNHMRFKGD